MNLYTRPKCAVQVIPGGWFIPAVNGVSVEIADSAEPVIGRVAPGLDALGLDALGHGLCFRHSVSLPIAQSAPVKCYSHRTSCTWTGLLWYGIIKIV
jgi:hypothetical protein